MNHKQYIHAWILEQEDLGLVFDMTCGNGHDTLFLAEHAESVVAVDIQMSAIEASKKRTEAFTNVHFIHASHDTIQFDKTPPISGAIYNLGYLPGSDKETITNKSSTVQSLKNIIPHLTHFLVVSCYRKHPGGDEEYLAVRSYLESLNLNIEVFEYEVALSPVTFLIKFK